jgi:hypothetical protein
VIRGGGVEFGLREWNGLDIANGLSDGSIHGGSMYSIDRSPPRDPGAHHDEQLPSRQSRETIIRISSPEPRSRAPRNLTSREFRAQFMRRTAATQRSLALATAAPSASQAPRTRRRV